MTQRLDSENELITCDVNGRLLMWDCDYRDPVQVLLMLWYLYEAVSLTQRIIRTSRRECPNVRHVSDRNHPVHPRYVSWLIKITQPRQYVKPAAYREGA